MKIVNVIWNSNDEPNQVWNYAVTESQAKTECASYNRKMRTGNWLSYEDANTIDEFIDDEYNPSYVPQIGILNHQTHPCLLYTSPSPRDRTRSRMPSSA